MPRRRELLAVVMASAVAGCGGLTDPGGSEPDDPDDDDDPAGTDEPAGADSPDGEDDPGEDDDSGPDDTQPTSTDQPGVSIATDYDSYAVDMEILYEQETSATMVHDADTQWDLANDRVYRRYELREEGDDVGDGLVTEYYVIGDAAYRVQLGSCVTAVTQVNPQQISSIAVPTGSELQQAQSLEYVGTESVDGTQAKVYTYDLAESMNIIGGEMKVYVGLESGYVLLLDGSYEVGAHDNPTVVTFTVRNHSFGETFDIEAPDSCEE